MGSFRDGADDDQAARHLSNETQRWECSGGGQPELSKDLSAQMKFLYDYRNAGHSCCLGHWALSRESPDFWGHPAWGWACLPAHTSLLSPLSSVEALFKLFKWPQGRLHFEDISHNLTVINGLCWLFLSLCWRFPGNFSSAYLINWGQFTKLPCNGICFELQDIETKTRRQRWLR